MPDTPPKVKNLRLPPDLHDAIAEIAERNERSGEAEIRIALREHVRRSKRAAAAQTA